MRKVRYKYPILDKYNYMIVKAMVDERKKANKLSTFEAAADAYNRNVMSYFNIIRRHVDKLELLVDDELWPLPKYRELLFIR